MACDNCTSGDSSIEVLWEGLHNRLYRFVYSRIPDEAEAEDIVQEVFLRIHTHLGTIREMDRLEGWIFQVARNAIIDSYRARSRLVALSDFPVEDEDREEDAGQSLAPSIRELVLGLPGPYREALVLTEYEGLSQQALAERLGISLSGAKSRVQRARQKIRDALLSCCHFEFDARGNILDYRDRCCCCGDQLLS